MNGQRGCANTGLGLIETERLSLSPLLAGHSDAVFSVYSDPETWLHLPAGRHTRRAQSDAVIARSIKSWKEFGLGEWAIFYRGPGPGGSGPDGSFVGTGGVSMTPAGVWNLGYRLSPSWWGRGLASEVARAAVDAAKSTDSSRPITARILTNNPASASVARRVGLSLIWEGPTTADAADGIGGQIYADRAVGALALDWLVRHV